MTEEFAKIIRSYRCTKVYGDRYGGEWPREQFRKHGVNYEPSEKSKSDLYRELLPLINSGAVDLLEHDRLLTQSSPRWSGERHVEEGTQSTTRLVPMMILQTRLLVRWSRLIRSRAWQTLGTRLCFRKWGLRDDPQNRALLVGAGLSRPGGPKTHPG